MLRAQPKPELKPADDPAEKEMTVEFYDLTPLDSGATGSTTKSSFQVGKVAGKNQPDEEKTIEDSPKQPALPPPLDGAEVISLLKELSPKDRWTEEGAKLRSVGRYLVVRHYPRVHREVQLTMMKLGVVGNRYWWQTTPFGRNMHLGGGFGCGEHLKIRQDQGGFSGP